MHTRQTHIFLMHAIPAPFNTRTKAPDLSFLVTAHWPHNSAFVRPLKPIHVKNAQYNLNQCSAIALLAAYEKAAKKHTISRTFLYA